MKYNCVELFVPYEQCNIVSDDSELRAGDGGRQVVLRRVHLRELPTLTKGIHLLHYAFSNFLLNINNVCNTQQIYSIHAMLSTVSLRRSIDFQYYRNNPILLLDLLCAVISHQLACFYPSKRCGICGPFCVISVIKTENNSLLYSLIKCFTFLPYLAKNKTQYCNRIVQNLSYS